MNRSLKSPVFSTDIGELIVIKPIFMKGVYIAEIISKTPLIVKVEEMPTAYVLKENTGGFFILEKESAMIQTVEGFNKLVRQYAEDGIPLRTGLKKLGIEDGKIYEILSD
jgi:hypothetical protein